MKIYYVSIPIAGYISQTVEYNDDEDPTEDEIIETALEQDWNYEDIEELNTYQKICNGNVCYASLNQIEIDEEWIQEEEKTEG